MILSKNSSIADLYSKGQPVQRLYSKGALVWERGGLPPPPEGVVLTDVRACVTIASVANMRVSLGWSPTNTIDKQLWIDWGDGTRYITKDYSVAHSYKSPGNYIVHIKSRQTKSVHFLNLVGDSHVSELLDGSHLGSDLVSCDYLAYKHGTENEPQSRIERFPNGFFDPCINLESLNGLVMGNTYFNSIQQGIFKNCVKLKKMSSNFANVPRLTNIPNDFYPHTNINVSLNFAGTPIRKIPSGFATAALYGNELTTISDLAINSPGTMNNYIGEIPEDFFSKVRMVQSILGVFCGLPKVKSIPSNLFSGMSKLKKINNLIDSPLLQSIPLNLFEDSPDIISFRNAFNGCTGVTSDVPRLWETHPNADGTGCFRGCVNAANYSEIPDNWK